MDRKFGVFVFLLVFGLVGVLLAPAVNAAVSFNAGFEDGSFDGLTPDWNNANSVQVSASDAHGGSCEVLVSIVGSQVNDYAVADLLGLSENELSASAWFKVSALPSVGDYMILMSFSKGEAPWSGIATLKLVNSGGVQKIELGHLEGSNYIYYSFVGSVPVGSSPSPSASSSPSSSSSAPPLMGGGGSGGGGYNPTLSPIQTVKNVVSSAASFFNGFTEEGKIFVVVVVAAAALLFFGRRR